MSCHMMKCNVNRKIMNRYIIVEFAPRSSNDNETVGRLCVLYDIFLHIFRFIAQLRPWHQPSRAGVSTIFTWRWALVGWASGVTLSSRAPRQPGELKFGTGISLRE